MIQLILCFKNDSSKAYECALTSEATVEFFNGKFSHYIPLRNEEHKSIFVIEIVLKDYIDNIEKFPIDLNQIETVFYVLHKCQEELLEEHFLGPVKKSYGIKNLF